MKLGITKNTLNEVKFRMYENWLLRFNPSIEFCELSVGWNRPDGVDGCDGLLLTGGGDVHPGSYGKGEALERASDVSSARDEFEFTIIDRAFERKMPILGICRGLQSMNVHLGGTLYLDLESDGFSRHTEIDGRENRHLLLIERASMLGSFLPFRQGEVNSSHHQAAEKVGRDLMVGARSKDRVIESMEWAEKSGKSFLLLVQWHPERMKDTSNPMAENVARLFLGEVQSYRRTSLSEVE